MVQAHEEWLERRPMSWEEYAARSDKRRSEWVDGEAILMSPVSGRHGRAATNVAFTLKTHLERVGIGVEVGLWLPRNRLRGPDVVVAEHLPDEGWLTEPPLIVVEVLSPTTRSEDTVRKPTEYAEGRVGQLWLVDPDHRTLDVYANRDGAWDLLLHLDASSPRGAVTVGDHGTVPLDLDEILGPAGP